MIAGKKAAKRYHWGPWGRSWGLYHSIRKIWSFEGNHDEISSQWREILHINHTIPSHTGRASQAEHQNLKISRFWPSSWISSKLTFIIRKWYTFYICICMYMGLSTHIGHSFYNPTEFKKKLPTKSSSSLIFRDSTDFIGWPVGRGPEVVKSEVGWKISRLVVEISKKNSENLDTFAIFYVIEPREES